MKNLYIFGDSFSTNFSTIDEIELSTGINFMPKLPVSSKLEKEKANLNDWSGLH